MRALRTITVWLQRLKRRRRARFDIGAVERKEREQYDDLARSALK